MIEFFGLPGSGKSTLCKEIARETKYKLSSYYIENLFGKIYRNIFFHLFFLNSKLFKKYLNLKKIIYENDAKYINNINVDVKLENYLKFMIFIYFIEGKNKKYIIDEGIIHYCMALHAEYNIELTKIEKIKKLLIHENLKIYGLSNNMETILKQIKKRSRKVSAIDFLNEKQLKKVLVNYQKIFDIFSKEYVCLYYNDLKRYVLKKL